MGRRRLFNDKEKWCNKCKKWLPLDAFAENRRTASGRQDYCKTCHSAYGDSFWGKVATVEKTLQEKFGMEPQDYLDLWNKQDKKCLICTAALILYQRDTHVHAFGMRRILVCSSCDVGLTAFGDDVQLLLRAVTVVSSTP